MRRNGRWTALDAVLLVPLALVVLMVGGVLAVLALRLPAEGLFRVLLAEETLFALRLSLTTSLAALAAALVLALPSAYLLARRDFPGRRLLETLLDLPMIMPPLVAGLGLLFLFGRRGLGGVLADLGIDVLFTPLGVIVAQTFVATTVLLRAAMAAFSGVEERAGEVAATLGASPWDAFRSVELPLALPAILAGAVIAWARALGEFGATLLLAGATRLRTETLPMAVYLNIATGETGVAVGCALILLAAAFLLLLALRTLTPQVNARGGAHRGC
jgi:molybdate transport system permease protein